MRRRLPAQRRLWSWLSDCKPALVLAAVFGLLLALAALVMPLLLTVLVDHVLTRGQLAWGGVVVGLMAGLGVVTYLLTDCRYPLGPVSHPSVSVTDPVLRPALGG